MQIHEEYFQPKQKLGVPSVFCLCDICEKKTQNDSSQAVIMSDEKRKIRAIIAKNNMTDELLHRVICYCAAKAWVEELRLCVKAPRSSVKHFDIY